MPLRASLFLPTTACPSLNILNDPGCSATKLIGKSLFGTNRGYLARSGTRVSDHVVRTTNSDTHVQGSRHKCNCPVSSKILLSKWEVPAKSWPGATSGTKILVGRNIGQQANIAQSVKPPQEKNPVYVEGNGLKLLGPYALLLVSSRAHDGSSKCHKAGFLLIFPWKTRRQCGPKKSRRD